MAVLLSALFAVGKTPPDTMTGVFDERVKSLQVRLDGDNFAAPVVVLGTPDRIVINFDILAEDRDYLRYSLTHCNAFWQPSGAGRQRISRWLQRRHNRRLPLLQRHNSTLCQLHTINPERASAPRQISGNYLLKVYNEDDPDAILLQCRFMISEETAPIALSASAQTDIDYNKSHQQLSIIVDSERAHVEDPFNDLIVIASQNGRLDSETAFRQPLRMQGKRSVYEHQPQLIFDAGNEYRRLEAVSDSYPGMAVERIEYFAPYYHYVLYPDAPRSADEYAYDQTQHGRYFIRNYASDDSDIEADYGVVHFTLDMPEQPGAMIFIDGDFRAAPLRRQFTHVLQSCHTALREGNATQTGCLQLSISFCASRSFTRLYRTDRRRPIPDRKRVFRTSVSPPSGRAIRQAHRHGKLP